MPKKNQLRARVRYVKDYKITLSKTAEVYLLETYDEQFGWCVNTIYPLEKRENAKETEGCDYVHFSLVKRIGELLFLGYEFTTM